MPAVYVRCPTTGKDTKVGDFPPNIRLEFNDSHVECQHCKKWHTFSTKDIITKDQ